jgi:hypothetical protein
MSMSVQRPIRAPSLAAGGVILLAGLAGCRGRAEFHRGAEHLERGEYRAAYYHYWEAYRLGPSSERLDALRLAGRSVGREEGERALEAEASGDLRLALEAFALALEYDPASPGLIEGYSRVRGLLETWEALLSELELARAASPADPWRELGLLRAMADHPTFSIDWKDDLARAASRAGAGATGELRALTFEAPLPGEPESLDRLEQDWIGVLGRLSLEAEREEEAETGAEAPHAREAASWRVIRDALEAPAAEALDALELIAGARSGIAWYDKANRLEGEGDLPGAIAAFERAAVHHGALDGAAEGAVRARARLSEALHGEAALLVEAREWERAAGSLERLLRHVPEDEDARSLLARCREEVSDLLAKEARAFEAAGLPANALVRHYQSLRWEPARAGAREAIRRLETALEERLHPRWRVVFLSEDAGDRRARRDLWGVGEDTLIRLEKTLVERVEAALNASSFDGRSRREELLTIEDLDFSSPRGERSRGAETTRFVASIDAIDNPDLPRARAQAEAARARLAAARAREELAPLRKAALASTLLRIARLRREQAETALDALPTLVPAVEWATASHATAVDETRAELACRYRTGGESRWAAVSLELRDRIVVGDPGRGVPPDPEEGPSRREAIHVLGERLAAAIARDVPAILAARDERFYRDALANIGARSFDLAVENLVAFLRSRRGARDRLAEDAARRLEEITGCALPAPGGTRDASR